MGTQTDVAAVRRVRMLAFATAALFLLSAAMLLRLGLLMHTNWYVVALAFSLASYAPQVAYAKSMRAWALPLTYGDAPRWANVLSGLGTLVFLAATATVLLNR